METRENLYNILKTIVSKSECDLEFTKDNLSKAYSLSVSQGVSGVAFKGLHEIMEDKGLIKSDLVDSLAVYDKWFRTTASIIMNHHKVLSMQRKLSSLLQEARIKAVMLKGLSISHYYMDESLRAFGDVDIYSPSDYDRLDNLIKSIGQHYRFDYYRHSECKVHGVMVENHKFLTDIRGQRRFLKLEKFLSGETQNTLSNVQDYGLFKPSESVTFIFFVYHALIHFIYEKISLKFLVDWCMMLKRREELDLDFLDEKLTEFGLMRFAAVMTTLCMDKLGLPEEYVPKKLLKEVKILDRSLVNRFENDMYSNDYEGFTSNSLRDRIKRGVDFYHKRWKIKEFLGTSLIDFLWEKTYALLS